MKKQYISPVTSVMLLHSNEHLLIASAHSSGDVTDILFGGDTDGGMYSDTKDSGDWDIWGNGSDDEY